MPNIQVDTIVKRMDGWINKQFVTKPQIAKYLVEHERKRKCAENICDQVLMYELKKGPSATIEKIAELIDVGTKMFCKAALDHAEQRALSETEKKKIEKDNLDYQLSELEGEQKEMRKFYGVKEDDKT